jgi:hypothetical protein
METEQIVWAISPDATDQETLLTVNGAVLLFSNSDSAQAYDSRRAIEDAGNTMTAGVIRSLAVDDLPDVLAEHARRLGATSVTMDGSRTVAIDEYLTSLEKVRME